jgi:hypothetical protein
LLIGAGTKLDPTMFSAHGLRSGYLARASDLWHSSSGGHTAVAALIGDASGTLLQ